MAAIDNGLDETGRFWRAEPTGRVFEQYVKRAAVASEQDIFFLVEVTKSDAAAERE